MTWQQLATDPRVLPVVALLCFLGAAAIFLGTRAMRSAPPTVPPDCDCGACTRRRATVPGRTTR